MSNQFAGLNLYTRSFGIAGIHGFDICRSNNSAFITRVVDHQLVALLHLAEMFNGGGIGYTIPDGGVIFLQIGKAVHGGFSFEEVVHSCLYPDRREGSLQSYRILVFVSRAKRGNPTML